MTRITWPAVTVGNGKRHYEDFVVGETHTFGRKAVAADGIKAFARAFDPQPLHLDEEAAKTTLIGRLCASGWHTCGMLMRMMADDMLVHAEGLGAPGVEEIRFSKPVFPGDVLTARQSCRGKRVLRSRPDVGLCNNYFELLNQSGDVAMSWDVWQMYRVRSPGGEARAEGVPAPAAAAAAPSPTTATTPGTPGPGNHLEDLVVGTTIEIGSHTFIRDEIIDFARKFDPQPFHLDEDAGKRSLFGGLAASGWHTSAIWLRHLLDYRRRIADQILFQGGTPARYGPSPGAEKLRWIKPVLAGDTLRFTTRLREKIDSKSRPTVGLIVADNEAWNQKGDLVFTVVGKMFVERRRAFDPASTGASS
jgi:acyl dehydratase